ncbi:MAG: hypothetical protein JNM85_00580 [Chthonomonas sp.]|nr:hypothetical protein [Chthonomonas sp.]
MKKSTLILSIAMMMFLGVPIRAHAGQSPTIGSVYLTVDTRDPIIPVLEAALKLTPAQKRTNGKLVAAARKRLVLAGDNVVQWNLIRQAYTADLRKILTKPQNVKLDALLSPSPPRKGRIGFKSTTARE